MNINDFVKVIKEMYIKYKKIFWVGIIIVIALFIFCSILQPLLSKIDEATATYYEVTFNTNGGTAVASQKIRKGRTISSSIKTEKYGFELIGWNNKGKNFDFSTPIKENMILSANWKANGNTITHTVTFETYGGTIIENIEVSEGKTFTKPFDPEKEEYKFAGWYLNEQPYDFVKTGVTNDITLKAKWERTEYLDKSKSKLEQNVNLFSNLSGTWYLKDYEDIYITITEEDNGFGTSWYFIKWYNIDLLNDCQYYLQTLYQNSYSSEKIELSDNLHKLGIVYNEEELTMTNNQKEYTFVRTKGVNNKYTGTIYEKAIGRWYLENSYSSYIDITAEKTDQILDYDSYCIRTTNINIGTLQLGSSTDYGCVKAYDESLFKDLGITIDGEMMTVKTLNGSKIFTLNKVITEGSVTGVKLDKIALILEKGKKETLFATVFPKAATNTKVTWESSDPSIVSVTGNPNVITVASEGVRYSGTLTAINPGTATITVKTEDGNYIATCKVVVPGVQVNSVSLNKQNTTIYIGNFETLKATIEPSNASNQKLIWSSSNPEVAPVNENGHIEGKKEGTALITVKTEDGKQSATCKVEVKYMVLNVVTAMNETRSLIDGKYVSGIKVNVTPSGGSGEYKTYQIKLYYNHQLVKEETAPTLFYPSDLKGNYYAEITVIDTEGHQSFTTKEYIRN